MSVDRILQTGGYGRWARGLLERIRGKEIAYPLGYMASLDGARGLLTLGVLLAHTRMALFSGAMVYMDVFFTMSGFLITSLLIKDFQKRGRISLKNFYLRRFMRLYPALTAMVVVFLALSWIFSDRFEVLLTEALVSWFISWTIGGRWGSPGLLYRAHLVAGGRGTVLSALAPGFHRPAPSRRADRQDRICHLPDRPAVLGLAVLAHLHRRRHRSPLRCFRHARRRAAVGCALAVLLKAIDIADHPLAWRLCALAMLPIALGLLAAGFTMDHNYRWYYYVSPLFGALPAAIAIVGSLHPDRNIMHMIQEHPVPVFIGRICYGLYIWHFPIFTWIVGWAGEYRYGMVLLIGWPLTFAVATLSFYLIERPFMRARPGV